MKTLLVASFVGFTVLLGCAHRGTAQNPPTPIFTCQSPAIVGNTPGPYLPVGSPVTPTNTTDSPAPGTYCYVVETVQGTGNSGPSNTAMITVPNTTQKVTLTWNAPPSDGNSTPYTYQLFRVAAVSTIPGAPALNPATVADNTPLVIDPLTPQKLLASLQIPLVKAPRK